MKLSTIKLILRLAENPKFRKWLDQKLFKIAMRQSMTKILKERFK